MWLGQDFFFFFLVGTLKCQSPALTNHYMRKEGAQTLRKKQRGVALKAGNTQEDGGQI